MNVVIPQGHIHKIPLLGMLNGTLLRKSLCSKNHDHGQILQWTLLVIHQILYTGYEEHTKQEDIKKHLHDLHNNGIIIHSTRT